MPIKHKNNLKSKLINLSLPTRHNQYRPWLASTSALILIAVLLVLAHVFSNGLLIKKLNLISHEQDDTSESLLSHVNQERRAVGRNNLVIDERLNRAARRKLNHMFSKQYWAHTSPDNVEAWSFIKAENYLYEESAENLGKGFTSSEGVVAGWNASRPHRLAMLNPIYENAGFASKQDLLNGRPVTLHVGLFAKPLSGASVVDAADGKKALALQGGAAEYAGGANTVHFSLTNPLSPESTLDLFGKVSLAILLCLLAIYSFQHYHISKSKLEKSKQTHESILIKIAIVIFAICLVVVTSYGSIS